MKIFGEYESEGEGEGECEGKVEIGDQKEVRFADRYNFVSRFGVKGDWY
jgi:hypothetical protein